MLDEAMKEEAQCLEGQCEVRRRDKEETKGEKKMRCRSTAGTQGHGQRSPLLLRWMENRPNRRDK